MKDTRMSLLNSGRVKIAPNSVGKRESDVGSIAAGCTGLSKGHFGPHVTLASVYSDAPMYWQRKVTPVSQMTEKERDKYLATFLTQWRDHDNGKTYDPKGQLSFLEMELLPE